MNFALSIRKYTVHLPLYLTQLSLLLRAVNKLCLQLSVKDSVGSNIMVDELYISLYLEQNSPLDLPASRQLKCQKYPLRDENRGSKRISMSKLEKLDSVRVRTF